MAAKCIEGTRGEVKLAGEEARQGNKLMEPLIKAQLVASSNFLSLIHILTATNIWPYIVALCLAEKEELEN